MLNKVGDGRNTKVWLNNWLMDVFPRAPHYRKDAVIDLTMTVNELLDQHSNSWNVNLVRQLFSDEDIDLVLNTKILPSRTDSIVWGLSNQKQSIGSSVRLSFPWLLWQICKARNKFCFEQINPLACDIVSKAREEATIWLNLHGNLQKSPHVLPIVSGSERKYGAGWIIHNSVGKVLFHSRRSFSGVRSPAHAGLLAITWATTAVKEHKLRNVQF
uniref:RNase H type-1 domain-containing protein n=1 Tax=Brassica oleracea TaxID=3712 RepID=A0A3P6GJ35_BRAOL|nr:unnamed protein product [Brassica oleracea]